MLPFVSAGPSLNRWSGLPLELGLLGGELLPRLVCSLDPPLFGLPLVDPPLVDPHDLFQSQGEVERKGQGGKFRQPFL